MQLEEPGIAIRLLKSLCLLEELHLAGDVGCSKMLRVLLLHQAAQRKVLVVLGKSHHNPERIHRGVPVITSVEGTCLAVVDRKVWTLRILPEILRAFRRSLGMIYARERPGG